MIAKKLFIASILCALAAGCCGPQKPLAMYVSEIDYSQLPGRVVVVPFLVPECSEEIGPIATNAVALEFQRILQVDVLAAAPDDDRLCAESAMWDRGRVDIDSLVEARRSYLADAFLFGAVTHYKPYDPPVLGIKLRLVCARTGEVLWAAGGVFDARDNTVRDLGEKYYRCSALSENLYGPDLIFMSPNQYSAFIAAQLLSPLDQQIQLGRQLEIERQKKNQKQTVAVPPNSGMDFAHFYSNSL